MFICDNCQGVSEPNEKPILVVTEIRPKEYRNEGMTTKGHEIAKTNRVCKECDSTIPKEFVRLGTGTQGKR